jgi:hypothetical protein
MNNSWAVCYREAEHNVSVFTYVPDLEFAMRLCNDTYRRLTRKGISDPYIWYFNLDFSNDPIMYTPPV